MSVEGPRDFLFKYLDEIYDLQMATFNRKYGM